jgi:Tfp pilus assembly protein FimT
MSRGFTIIELVISVAIFVFMTTLVVAKYGNFNTSTLLTDTAYDTALVVRLAQTYGVSVKNSAATGTNFNLPYGVDFNLGSSYCGGSTSAPNTFVLFADSNPSTADGLCGVSDTSITPYTLSQGTTITSLCAGADQTSCETSGQSMDRLDISFVRPNPEGNICGTKSGVSTCSYAFAEVVLSSASGGSSRTITIRQNGQISVNK